MGESTFGGQLGGEMAAGSQSLYLYKEIYYEKLGHTILEAEKFQICRLQEHLGRRGLSSVVAFLFGAGPLAWRMPTRSGESHFPS